MTRKQTGWDLRSNLKNKPNAQGTLFSGGKEQIPDEKRYPRGYTPERMRAVNQRMGMVQHRDWEEESNIHPGGAFEDARRTVARSTVPAEQLEGLRVRVNALNKSTQMGRDGVEGTYTRMWSGERPQGAGLMDLSLNAVNNATVIHEIGHHVSHEAGTTHSAYDSVLRRGEEEGFADHFADKHFVPLPKREMNRRMLDDSRRGSFNYDPLPDQTLGRAEEFHSGYERMRPRATRVPNDLDRQWQGRREKMHAEAEHVANNPRLPGLERGTP